MIQVLYFWDKYCYWQTQTLQHNVLETFSLVKNIWDSKVVILLFTRVDENGGSQLSIEKADNGSTSPTFMSKSYLDQLKIWQTSYISFAEIKSYSTLAFHLFLLILYLHTNDKDLLRPTCLQLPNLCAKWKFEGWSSSNVEGCVQNMQTKHTIDPSDLLIWKHIIIEMNQSPIKCILYTPRHAPKRKEIMKISLWQMFVWGLSISETSLDVLWAV